MDKKGQSPALINRYLHGHGLGYFTLCDFFQIVSYTPPAFRIYYFQKIAVSGIEICKTEFIQQRGIDVCNLSTCKNCDSDILIQGYFFEEVAYFLEPVKGILMHCLSASYEENCQNGQNGCSRKGNEGLLENGECYSSGKGEYPYVVYES